MSLPAPVETSPAMISSATQPPISIASSSPAPRLHHELVLLRERQRVAERAASGITFDLVHLVRVGQDVGDERVSTLVVRDQAPLVFAHHAALALGPAITRSTASSTSNIVMRSWNAAP